MQRNWMYALGLIGLAMGLLSTGCNPDGTPFTLQPAPAPQALSGKTETPPEYAKTEVIEPEPETKDPMVAEVDPEAAAFLERLSGSRKSGREAERYRRSESRRCTCIGPAEYQ